MNQTLTGSALTLHNLGLAAGVGGSLFGQMALHPAIRSIDDSRERGAVLRDAWQRFTPANAFSIGAVAITWLVGRAGLSGAEVDGQTRALVVAKDVLVAVYAATGVASIVLGRRQTQRSPEVQSPQASLEAGERVGQSVKRMNRLGLANLVAGAGIIALTALLNVKAERSQRWRLISKLLP